MHRKLLEIELAVFSFPKRLLSPYILTNFHKKSKSFLKLFVSDSEMFERMLVE